MHLQRACCVQLTYKLLQIHLCSWTERLRSCCDSDFSFLADHIDERTICNAVSPTKDVDGFHVVNVGRMCLDQSTMLPATPWGVWEIIKRTGNRSDHLPPLRGDIQWNKRSKLNIQILVFQVFLLSGKMSWLQAALRMWACPSPCYCIQTADMRGLEVGYSTCGFVRVLKDKKVWMCTVQVVNVISVAGDATVTISHRYTPKEQLRQHTKIADIIVAAAGLCHNLFSCDWTACLK